MVYPIEKVFLFYVGRFDIFNILLYVPVNRYGAWAPRFSI